MIVEADYIKTSNRYDFSNYFNKGYDIDIDAFFNIPTKNIFFKSSSNISELDDVYKPYTVMDGDTWTLISHKMYKTVELWWFICKFNNIQNPFNQPTPNTIIKILDMQLVDSILSSLRSE
jgi:nucleoid-associated protein YgaU